MSDDGVNINQAELLRVAQDLNAIVVSLDRIGSANAEVSRERLAAAVLDFFDDWHVFAKLANAREVVDGALLGRAGSETEREAIEQQLDRGPYWPNRDSAQER
jgi:hypothetical protein